jgi:AcrR family transcriptional regulator
MNTRGKNSKPYHHGNLRQALVVAAESLLREEGAAKLSLRAAARQAGVSQAAPYAHFDSRRALLAAVAAQGFRRLRDNLARAEKGIIGGAERMRHLARGYVRFAVDHPMLFRLMFGAELSGMDGEELRSAGQESYAFIQSAVAARLEESDGGQVGAETASTGAWALVHGLAMLVVDGKIEWPATTSEQNALVDRTASVYSTGLG